jgi:hypothetical protein
MAPPYGRTKKADHVEALYPPEAKIVVILERDNTVKVLSYSERSSVRYGK